MITTALLTLMLASGAEQLFPGALHPTPHIYHLRKEQPLEDGTKLCLYTEQQQQLVSSWLHICPGLIVIMEEGSLPELILGT